MYEGDADSSGEIGGITGEPTRRDEHGLATMTAVAANLDKIRDFAPQKIEDGLDYEAGFEAPRAKKRKPRRSSPQQRVTYQRGRAKRNPVRT